MRFRIITGITLLIAGISLIAIPFYQEWQQKQDLQALDEALNMLKDEESTDGFYHTANKTFKKEELENIYELQIPSIDLEQKVLGELTEENLSLSLTQIKPDQVPGEGNFTIAGHRGYRGDRHFRQLPDVEIGDDILLIANGETYIYQAERSEVIEATDIDILENT